MFLFSDSKKEQNLWLGAKNGIFMVSMPSHQLIKHLHDVSYNLQQVIVSKRRLFSLTTTGKSVRKTFNNHIIKHLHDGMWDNLMQVIAYTCLVINL